MDDQVQIADRETWAREQFGEAELKDVRRTRRLVLLGSQMAANSSGSIPQQTGRVADMKAAYRLFAEEDVTHEGVCGPHFRRTRKQAEARPRVFLAQDTMVLDYTGRKIEGLGPIGDGNGQGLHQQNVLAVDAASRLPLGLLYQRHHRREPVPEGESRSQRRQRPLTERESYWWVQAIEAIGSPATDVAWIHVLDRGGDAFAIIDATRATQTGFIIRAAQNRRITPQAGHAYLLDDVRSLPSLGTREVTVRTPEGRPRTATLYLTGGAVHLLPSATEPALRHQAPIRCQVVRVWEANPPDDVERVEWILLTSLPAETFDETIFVVDGYACRWIVEELHKCEKTGCRVEERELRDTAKLEPLLGMLSVLAVRLLLLKYVARDDPDRPAQELFTEQEVAVMACYLEQPAAKMTVGMFWRGIGRLGGHPGRKRDGPLGWLRAWRGWQAFQMILLGASLSVPRPREKCG